MNFTLRQENFYDKHPTLSPWPRILSKRGLKTLYKPREVFFKKELDKLKIGNADNVLEIGSGQGIFLKRICGQYGCIAKGVDISENSVTYANINYSNNDLKFVKANATELPFAGNSFDRVISFDTLEHVENQNGMLSEIIRVTKPHGKFLIYTLNRFDSFTLDWIWEKFGFDIHKRAMHKRSLFVDPKKVVATLRKKGCKTLEIIFYGGIFTIAFDEAIMASLLIFGKLGLFKIDILGKITLYILDKVSKIFYPLLNYLDGFWYKKGRSLGFAITGIKE